MADDDLSPGQTETLLQFQDLIASDDIVHCRNILERSNWDLEVAVQRQFSDGAEELYENRREPRIPRTPPVDSHPTDQQIFTVARPSPEGFLGWSYFVVAFPFKFVVSTFTDIFKFIYRLLRPDPRRRTDDVTNPRGDVRSFINNFEAQYGNDHPLFHSGTYGEALNEAKSELQFLLVYLHSEEHQDTDYFCRNTLCDPEVRDFLSTRLIFWGCSISTPEGYRVSQALRESTYPFLALVVLRENRMTVVAKIEGPVEADELVERLEDIIDENETSLEAARAERTERSITRTLRDEQDAAYLESLRQDQEKERVKKEAAAQIEREKQAAEEAEMAKIAQLEEVAKRKETIRSNMAAEPDADEDNVVRILLKLPNGTRLERRFYRAQSMEHLYNYVFVHESAPDDFQIVTNFPRRVLDCLPKEGGIPSPSFADAGLGKSEMLFVHDNEA